MPDPRRDVSTSFPSLGRGIPEPTELYFSDLALRSASARWIAKSGANRALSVVLLRLRIAEQRHEPVAEFFQHMAADSRHRVRRFVEIGADEIAPVLRVEPRRKARRADEVAEHHRNRPALGSI